MRVAEFERMTFEQLCALSDDAILRTPNLGAKSLAWIRERHPWTEAGRAYVQDLTERAIAAYRNDGFIERACDRCGKLYRGPSTYCSLACAIADA
jgi:hypothetical protein